MTRNGQEKGDEGRTKGLLHDLPLLNEERSIIDEMIPHEPVLLIGENNKSFLKIRNLITYNGYFGANRRKSIRFNLE